MGAEHHPAQAGDTNPVPELQRPRPVYEQIYDQFKRRMAPGGDLSEGNVLPPVRDIAGSFTPPVSTQTVWRALDKLVADQLATRGPRGEVTVGPPRLVPGPQQLLAARYPQAARIEVTAAEYLEKAPPHVRAILGIEEVPRYGLFPVIRREQVHYLADGRPFLLAVAWWPAEFAEPVRELQGPEPVAWPGALVPLIGVRTGRVVTRCRMAREARRILDDGREGPRLSLMLADPVLAETAIWLDPPGADDNERPRGAVEYDEYDLIPGMVTENEFAV
jgi:hypothetical protein